MATTLEQLYALKIPAVRDLFINAMQDVVDEATLEEMIEAIENNDLETLYQASGFTPVVLNKVIDEIETIYGEAASLTLSEWPKRIKTLYGYKRPLFNIRNERVEQDLKKYSSDFVTNITDTVKENLRTTLQEGLARGDNPRQTALNIVGRVNSSTKKREGGIIGLSTNQLRWSNSARRYLENLDEKYFELGLRDKRFDSIVKKAIADGKKLKKEDVDRLVSAYNKKALKYRGDAIARTETMQSINRAEWAAISQNIEEGLIKPEQVRKWWDDTADGRTRLSHIDLGKRYNKKNTIAFDEPFVTSTGSKLLYPGDTSLGANPRETIHCRCKAQYNVDFVKEFTDE